MAHFGEAMAPDKVCIEVVEHGLKDLFQPAQDAHTGLCYAGAMMYKQHVSLSGDVTRRQPTELAQPLVSCPDLLEVHHQEALAQRSGSTSFGPELIKRFCCFLICFLVPARYLRSVIG